LFMVQCLSRMDVVCRPAQVAPLTSPIRSARHDLFQRMFVMIAIENIDSVTAWSYDSWSTLPPSPPR
jgi:hypothetical protein